MDRLRIQAVDAANNGEMLAACQIRKGTGTRAEPHQALGFDRTVEQRDSPDHDRAGPRLVTACDAAEQGALARPISTREPNAFSGKHGELEILQHIAASVPSPKTVHLEIYNAIHSLVHVDGQRQSLHAAP